MTDGVNRVFSGPGGFGSYGIFKRNNEQSQQAQEQQAPVNNHEETQVDPNKVMDFLNQYNFFVPEVKTSGVEASKVDPATEERISGYMEQFENIYGIVEKEFGTELAPLVMDLVMDKLMLAA